MKSIIIVEDDLSFRYLLKEMVEELGHELIAAVDNVSSAMLYLKSGRVPNVILLDVVLPGGMGTNLIGYVRANHKNVRIVMTTGLSEERLFKLVRPGEYDAVLHKPFTFDQLSATLAPLLGISD